jgi:ABC-type multidrug transport system permease subunit
LIGALLTALVVAREWERGTMEALLATPIRVAEILLGKITPYFVLGMGGLLLSVAMTIWLFDVPLRGSLVVLMGVSALFLLAALGMGLLISTLARNQFVAGQAAIIVTFLPAFMLSGFIFDIHSMPLIIQAVTYLIAARYYVAILQTVFAAGNVWSVIWPNALALAVMAAAFLLLVSPLRPVDILLGKAIPGFVIGAVEASFIILAAVAWFGVPLRGSLPALYAGLGIFLLSAIGVGLMISSLAVTQQQGLFGAFLFLVPAIILSGFATPIANMPICMQHLTLLNPLHYFMVILRSVFLEGATASMLWGQYWPMGVIGVATLVCAAFLFRRRMH